MFRRVRFSTVENIHQEVLKGEFRSPDTAPGSSSGDRDLLGKDCLCDQMTYAFTLSLAVPVDFCPCGLFSCFL